MRVDLGAIRSLGVFRNYLDFLIGLEIDKDGRAFEYGTNLLGIENMKQYNFVAAKAKGLDGAYNGFRILVKIGDDDGDAAPVDEFLEMMQRLGEIGARVRLRALECREEARQLARPRRWSDHIAHLFVEDDQARGIALVMNGEIEE